MTRSISAALVALASAVAFASSCRSREFQSEGSVKGVSVAENEVNSKVSRIAYMIPMTQGPDPFLCVYASELSKNESQLRTLAQTQNLQRKAEYVSQWGKQDASLLPNSQFLDSTASKKEGQNSLNSISDLQLTKAVRFSALKEGTKFLATEGADGLALKEARSELALLESDLRSFQKGNKLVSLVSSAFKFKTRRGVIEQKEKKLNESKSKVEALETDLGQTRASDKTHSKKLASHIGEANKTHLDKGESIVPVLNAVLLNLHLKKKSKTAFSDSIKCSANYTSLVSGSAKGSSFSSEAGATFDDILGWEMDTFNIKVNERPEKIAKLSKALGVVVNKLARTCQFESTVTTPWTCLGYPDDSIFKKHTKGHAQNRYRILSKLLSSQYSKQLGFIDRDNLILRVRNQVEISAKHYGLN